MTDIKVFEGITFVSFNEKSGEKLSAFEIFRKIGDNGIDIDMISIDLALSDSVCVGFTLCDDDLAKLLPLTRSENITVPAVNCGNVKFVIKSEDMINCPGFAAKIFTALDDIGCVPLMITTAVDEISILVRDSDSADVGKALEKLFE